MTRRRCFHLAGGLLLGMAWAAHAAPSVLGTQVSTGVLGDANGDGIANSADVQIVQANLNKAGNLSKGDFDGDGQVTANDLSLVNSNLNRPKVAAYFGKIVDYSTVAPGGALNFSFLGNPSMDRSLNLAFSGVSSNATQLTSGLYRYSSATLSRVADSTQTAASLTTAYENFGEPAIQTGNVTFKSVTTNSIDGLYNFNGSSVSKLSTGSLTTMGSPEVGGTSTVFTANSSGTTGLYTMVNAGAPTSLADTNSAIPGGTGTFTGFAQPRTDGTNYWFVGTGIGQSGIYKRTLATSLTALVDLHTTVPGSASTKFNAISNLAESGTSLSFQGNFLGGTGIYALVGGALAKVADTNTLIPGSSGKFSGFGFSTIGSTSVAFVGFDASGNSGIYAWIAGKLTRVIDTGVLLGGKRITNLTLAHDAVAQNRLAFKAQFSDGTAGVYVATVLPTQVYGDFTQDNKIDSADLAVLRRQLGKPGTESTGDLNGDGKVTLSDMQLFELVIGRSGNGLLGGDTDGNRKVDFYDMAVLRQNLGLYGSSAQGDFDGDGKVTLADMQILERNYGKTASVWEPWGSASGQLTSADVGVLGAMLVPEPGAAGMLVIGAGLALGRRRLRQ